MRMERGTDFDDLGMNLPRTFGMKWNRLEMYRSFLGVDRNALRVRLHRPGVDRTALALDLGFSGSVLVSSCSGIEFASSDNGSGCCWSGPLYSRNELVSSARGSERSRDRASYDAKGVLSNGILLRWRRTGKENKRKQ